MGAAGAVFSQAVQIQAFKFCCGHGSYMGVVNIVFSVGVLEAICCNGNLQKRTPVLTTAAHSGL